MSNDKTTLADAQPGGRVRLEDQAERARFEAWAGDLYHLQRMGDTYRSAITTNAWQAWQAALSAQPSRGGQGDAPEIEQLRALVSSILSTVSLGYQTGPYAYAGEDFGGYLHEAASNCRTILRVLSDLAARQPVRVYDCCGEVAGDLHWGDCVAIQWSQGQLLAQAVDLDELRRAVCVVGVVGQIDGHDVVRRNSVLDVIDVRRQRKVDSQAVGNG